MKAMDLLKYLDKADPAYVEEASDYNLLLYRKRRKRTRTALAACVTILVLAGVFLTKPALYAWETRNTVASWSEGNGFVYIGFGDSKPSSSVMISAEMPDRKKFSADTPFTLSVGLGQVSDYEYATLSVKAYGFEITDKDGNTVTDRYVRTLSDFDSEDYGVLYRDGKPSSPVTGCQYLEDFTFRFTGSENTTGWGVIEFSLQSRTENSSMGDYVTVYYTVQNGVLKLTHKSPVKGDQNGGLGAVLDETDAAPNEAKTVELSHEGHHITVSVTNPFLVRGEAWQEKIDINGLPLLSDFMVALYPKDSAEGHTIRLALPSTFSSMHDFTIPADAPLGSYDLIVTWYGSNPDGAEERPQWVYENFITVTEESLDRENINVRFDMETCLLYPGQFLGGLVELQVRVAPYGTVYPTDGFTAELIYAESLREKDFSFFIKRPDEIENGLTTVWAGRVPVDAPIGAYDLRITDPATGFTWTFQNAVTVIPDTDGAPPAYEDLTCEATALVEYLIQGGDVRQAVSLVLWEGGEDKSFFCSAELVYAEDGGEACRITVKDSPFSSTASPTYIPADAPVGGYDLIVTDQRYGYTWRFNHFIEVMSDPAAPQFGLYTDMEGILTVSRAAEETYTLVALVENRGMPVTVTVTPQTESCPAATLTFAEAPEGSGELFEIPLLPVTTPDYEPYEWTWKTGATVISAYEIMVTPDTPCGLYDLTLTYGDCTVTFTGAVEVVP